MRFARRQPKFERDAYCLCTGIEDVVISIASSFGDNSLGDYQLPQLIDLRIDASELKEFFVTVPEECAPYDSLFAVIKLASIKFASPAVCPTVRYLYPSLVGDVLAFVTEGWLSYNADPNGNNCECQVVTLSPARIHMPLRLTRPSPAGPPVRVRSARCGRNAVVGMRYSRKRLYHFGGNFTPYDTCYCEYLDRCCNRPLPFKLTPHNPGGDGSRKKSSTATI